MNMNKKPEARKLTYVEFPSKYVWKLQDRCWQPRKNYIVVGRIYSVSPSLGEAYYLRILLTKVKGPRSFEEIRTYEGVVYPTFRDACYARGLLDDDNEYIECIKEASFTGNGHYLRSLFGTLLLSNTLSRPEVVWEKTWEFLSEDILYNMRKDSGFSGFVVSDERLKKITLSKIENYLIRNGSSLRRFSPMPVPDEDSIVYETNRLINEELSWDKDEVRAEFNKLHNSLNDDQRAVYNDIMSAVGRGKGGVFFVYGYGGTGKTFLWKTLAASIRCNGHIVINVASSGIVSLLLSRGRTAHSRFHIPINLNEDSVCHIKPNSEIVNLLNEAKLIIWDEAPMVHKHAFEALDRTLKDVLSVSDSRNSELPFGGKTIVIGGDFRQILSVVQNGSRQDIVHASLCSSYIWSTCKVLKLTKNMRLSVGTSSSNIDEINNFAKWLLEIGEGNLGDGNDGESTIEIPNDLLITDSTDPIQSLIDFVYPSVLHRFKDRDYFSERTILAPKNEVVHGINDRLLALFPGEEVEYLSSDSLCPTEEINDPLHQDLYNPDVLNSVIVSGLPNHRLVLKLGVPVMLLRNIDQQNGLCNGTRLQITRLGKRVIEAEILSGGNVGSRTYIPRISMIPSDKKIPFKFQRRQFPITVCFAMTINKSQGQSLSRVGLYLRDPVFSNGQLYVTLSRVKTRDGVKLLIFDKDGRPTNKTANVVYKEIFGKL
ncbi:putative DNA helicase [Helianthus annuus]|uniref:ATP-dependent DNA helicase n=1 Tax=Helianthus annuus TaxID=4232 RepID=A0A9K3E0G7_HELAN|nr:putative DNA helicase [Helianthus annuus]KAJ0831426.1 putative DNA helicase [Helianthus annuus]